MEELRTRDIKEIAGLGGKVGNFAAFKNNLKSKYRISEEELEENGYDLYLWGYYNLFLYSDLIRVEVWEHVVRGLSYDEVCSKYDHVNLNYYRTMIYKETKKIGEAISINPLSIVRNKERLNNSHLELLKSLQETYPPVRNHQSKSYGLDLDFEKGVFNREFNSRITDDDFYGLLDALKYKSKNYRDAIGRGIPPEYIGYVEILLSKDEDDLTEVEYDRKRVLTDTLLLDAS